MIARTRLGWLRRFVGTLVLFLASMKATHTIGRRVALDRGATDHGLLWQAVAWYVVAGFALWGLMRAVKP